ncbi:flagellin lysine-N-methylase [uncultured Clostridium sp.]|uniref:flagellin lysine-N-methylase n=1 Tax=uncultured Clostridium sp. TaxID=59620 RepID=UPI002632FC1D|nr:flagellin lysine-N-methylase [uncultured Clostridium sp.]
MKIDYNILQYKGYENFSCIGARCRHTCCVDWDIDIDNETYKKYKVSNFFTKEMLEKNFTRKKSGVIKFRLNEKKGCPLQNESGLCDIHSNLGEEFLCKTCRIYPRMCNLVDNTLEKFLTTSCPAVNEIFLLDENQLSFDSVISAEDKEELSIKMRVDTRKDDYLKYFWDIRIFTISLLQNRDFDIEKRLIILGLVYNKINALISEKKIDDIKKILDMYTVNLGDKTLFENLDKLVINNEFKSKLLKALAFGKTKNNLLNMNENLNKLLEFDENGVSEKYNNAVNVKYKNYLDKYEYTLENYLVNIAYSSAMPKSNNGDMLSSYLYLAVQYAMVKTYLISVDNKEITTDDFVDIVTLTSRTLNHNANYPKNVVTFMNSISTGNLNMLAKVVNLIK